MYFVTNGGVVCHVLGDMRTGAALCGIKVSRFEFAKFKSGRPTVIVRERPTDVPLCKHCDKQQGNKL